MTISLIYLDNKNESIINKKRLVHQNFLLNSPFLTTKDLSKSERRSRELPPNSYNEKIWELSMNPARRIENYEPTKENLISLGFPFNEKTLMLLRDETT